MASKRQLRKKACTRKRYHATRESAERSARRTNNRDGRLVAYKCNFCDGWHVGHSRAHKAPQRRKGWYLAAVHGLAALAILAGTFAGSAGASGTASVWLPSIPGVALWYTVDGGRPVNVSQGGPVYLYEGEALVLHGVVDVDGDRRTGLPEAAWALQVVTGNR
jgi:hypothetical protein